MDIVFIEVKEVNGILIDVATGDPLRLMPCPDCERRKKHPNVPGCSSDACPMRAMTQMKLFED